MTRSHIKKLIERTPVVSSMVMRLQQQFQSASHSSVDYWETRYRSGGDSGRGSYGHLAQFKAGVLNQFVAENDIQSVIEFGCGDGNQLSLSVYPRYIGFDVSRQAIALCKSRFANDPTKSFYIYHPLAFVDNHALFRADLVLSLDVIYHLTEDDIYEAYMAHLFAATTRFVIIYSSNQNQRDPAVHVRQRRFTEWISENCTASSLVRKIPNRYPFERDDGKTSFSDFYIYQKKNHDR